MTPRLRVLASGLTLLLSTSALAHPGHETAGFLSALVHPLTGLDHLLAMIAVGLWAGLRGSDSATSIKPNVVLPAGFVAGSAVGTLLGFAGLFGPSIELALAASLLPLGLMLALHKANAGIAALGLVMACGALHGAAHGTELAGFASASVLGGFLLGTALLHVAGIVLARSVPESLRRGVSLAIGAGVAGTGLFLLA